jgi:hypothetical protein
MNPVTMVTGETTMDAHRFVVVKNVRQPLTFPVSQLQQAVQEKKTFIQIL